MKNEQGFTLLELMIVLAIIGIGTSLAVPAYNEWNIRYQLRQATTEIADSLTLSRMAAMNRNKAVTVTLAISGGQITVASVDSAGAQVLPGRSMQPNVNGISGVPAPIPSSAPITVQFSPRGLRSNPSGASDQVITLSSTHGLQYSVQIKSSGKTKWCASSTCT